MNLSDIATFTHSGYRDRCSWRGGSTGAIRCASWIDPENILPGTPLAERWAEKLADPARPLRLVFASNLLPAKGIAVLIGALRSWSVEESPVTSTCTARA